MPGRLLAALRERPGLIVSLPVNSPALARAAAEAGADALKVHINVRHEASGTAFGSLAEERDSLTRILAVGLPTGIVPGAAGALPSPADMHELEAMGVDFFDLYDHDMPLWLARWQGMTRAVAISQATPLEAAADLAALGFEMVEAAIIPCQGYGQPLSVADLAAYRRVRRATRLPIIVPTQRAIQPDDLPALLAIGMDAIMIGAIVTGQEPGSLGRATERFAAEIQGRGC
jgi:L-alanine-DL-glutamate epimerase-like enolase superfamily enzyme